MRHTVNDRRKFSMITEPVFADSETPYGPEYWRRDGTDRGSVVKVFRNPDELAAYADLHCAAHLWVHEDFEHDAWHVLDIDEPLEIGEDFLIFRRRPGIVGTEGYGDEDRLRSARDIVSWMVELHRCRIEDEYREDWTERVMREGVGVLYPAQLV